MPARLTVDLFRAARGVATAVTVRVVRDGRRIRSAECDLAQEGRLVARATLLQYRRSVAPPGHLWAASDGVAVGAATLFDQDGAFGSRMTTAVSNPAAQIDFADDPFPLRIG
jgi:hypothetical protein